MFWSVFCLIISSAYTCNLRAFLVATDFEKSIDGPRDLLDSGIQFYLPEGTSLVESVRSSPFDDHQELFKLTQSKNTFFRISRGWLPEDLEQEMLEKGGALIFPKDPVRMRFPTFEKKFGEMPFRISKQVGFSYHTGFLVAKFCPWKEDFNRVLSVLVERGFFKKLKRNYMSQKILLQDLDKDSIAPREFTNDHLLGAWYLLSIGIGASFLTFLIERSQRKPSQLSH